MEFDALRAAVVPGAAVVGRWPGIVCAAECADRQVLRRLLEVCAAASGPDPGRALARRLTMWLGGTDAPSDGLRFGTVAVTSGDGRSGVRGEQWAVFLYGPVGVVVPDRQVALSGAQAVAWTDRLLPRPDVPVVLALEGGPIPPGVIDGVHDLRAGVVPGVGAVLVPSGDGGNAADQGEEGVRRRLDDPLRVEPADRDRPRWGGTPEPALVIPQDGLLRGGEGQANGLPRGALENLVPELSADLGPDFGGGLGADRAGSGDRGRAHLRPVPSGSNGIGHRGRGPRRATTFDLGRFGGGLAHSREGGGEDHGSGTIEPPDAEHEGAGPQGAETREHTDDQATDHHSVPPRAGKTGGVPRFAAGAADVNDGGVNDTVRNERVRNGAGRDIRAVPDDFSPLDSPFGDLGRDEPGLNESSGLDSGARNGSATRGGPRNHSLNHSLDGTDVLSSSGGHNGHDLGHRNGRQNGSDAAVADLEPWPSPGADRTPDAARPLEADFGTGDSSADSSADNSADSGAGIHWFAARGHDMSAETELGPPARQDARRPRHGRQDTPSPEDDDPTAGTPRFGVQAVSPMEASPAATPPPVVAVPAPAPPVEPDQPPVRPAPLRAETILGTPADEPPLAPLEAGRPAGVAPDAPEDPLDDSHVRGQLCPRGHLNDPRLSSCAFCGSRIEETGGRLVAGPRPPLGLLVFDDGTTYTVDAEYLVGRMPEGDSRVASGALRSLPVEDPSGAVSRVHAEVRVTGWDVLLTDAGSRNGTYLSGPGDPEWAQLPAGQSHRLVPGTRVRLGGRSFLFESPSGAR